MKRLAKGTKLPGSPAGTVSSAALKPEVTRWAWALVALLVLVFFYPITLGKVFLSPDSVAPAGFAKLALNALRERHVYALWDPYHFLGMPTFGSLAFTPYVYPLDPVFDFLNRTLRFPDLTWLLTHYLLLALSMFAMLRALGAGPEGSTLGAVAFALTPNLVAVGAFGHGSQIMTAAYLPLLILLLDRFVRRGSMIALGGFALAAAMQFLRGHVQIVFYSWLALGAYALYLAITGFREGKKVQAWRALSGLIVGLVLGFGMSAFLYLPTQEYSKLSVRGAGEGGGAGLSYATAWSFSPGEMLTFVIPSMFGFGGRTYWGTMPFTDYPNYMGILTLALAVYGAVRWRAALRWYFVALASAALLMSFGKHFQPLYSALYHHLPFFNKFRVPVMVLVLVQFSTAALAALGVTAALERSAPTKTKGADSGAAWLRAAGLAAISGIVVVALLNFLAPSLQTAAMDSRPGFDAASARSALDLASLDAAKSAILLGLGFAVIGIYRRGRMTRMAAAIALLSVTAVDLWILDRKIMDPQIGSSQEYAAYFAETPEIGFLKSDPTLYRVLPMQWNDSRLAAFGIASIQGYHPAKPRLYQAFVDTVGIPSSLPTLRFLNVKYVLLPGRIGGDVPGVILRHDGEVKVYEIQGALPRAYMVHRLKPVRDDVVSLATIRTNGFDPAREALWTEPDPVPVLSEPLVPDSVRVLRYDFNESEYFVSTASSGLFVVGDQWDPDWRVVVDGERVAIHRVDYLMRGVLLPAGVHRVRFTYEPRTLEAGIRISLGSLIATLLLLGTGLLLRRGRGRGGQSGAPAGAAGEERTA